VTPPKLTSHRPLLGIALMLVSGTIMPVMNGFGKMLATSYPPEQVIWARLLTHLLWVLAFFLPRSGLGLFRTARSSRRPCSSSPCRMSAWPRPPSSTSWRPSW
jgi:hypothetical protein